MYFRFDADGKQIGAAEDAKYVAISGHTDWVELDAIDLKKQRYAVDAEGTYFVSDRLIADPEPEKEYLIWDFVQSYDGPKSAHPGEVVFPEQLNRFLPKVKKSVLGEPIEKIYYSDSTHTRPVIKIERGFKRDADDYELEEIIEEVSWAYTNGEWSDDTKILEIPVTDPDDRTTELKDRREAIITELKSLAREMGILSYAVELFNKYVIEQAKYVGGGSNALYVAIRDDDELEWLNSNLPNGNPGRPAILEYLKIGIEPEEFQKAIATAQPAED